jgi:DNA-binding transcriptional LysR family regulator
MNVTQPAISGAVAELESELGVKLFHRHGRKVELTSEGNGLMNYAVRIQDLVDEAGHRLTKRQTAHGETFQFGSIDAGAIYLLPDILRDYLAANPEFSFRYRSRHHATSPKICWRIDRSSRF